MPRTSGDIRLQQISIASPCQEPWDAMRGDDRVRHCERCQLNVYNFAEMTRDEVSSLLDSTNGRLCGRIFRRHDGTILLRDCPVGLAALRRKVVRFAAVAAALFLSTAAGVASGALSRRGDDIFDWGIARTLRESRPFDALLRWSGRGDVSQGMWMGGVISTPLRPIAPSGGETGMIVEFEGTER
jgi:hypothetical protein